MPDVLRAASFWVVVLAASTCAAQEAKSNIRDLAGMFDYDTVRQARQAIARIERMYHVSVLVETIDSLNGEPVDDAAVERDKAAGSPGVYLLMARESRRMSKLVVSQSLTDRLPEARRSAIREAMLEEFKKADFDAGLLKGIEAIERALAETQGAAPRTEARREQGSGAPPTSPAGELVVRNQVHLLLNGAQLILSGAQEKSRSMNLKVNIAVVDDGGHLIAFARMDGARPASGYTAITKATTAATFRAPTGPVPPGTNSPDPLLNLSLQNAALASGGKLTTLYGGVPVIVDGQIIGAVGVGGGSGEQDAEIARAGIAKLVEQLKESGEKK